jgi:FtsH-binding integral membrane protein
LEVLTVPASSEKPVVPPADAEKAAERKKDIRATLATMSELLFVILPFIVIGITLAYRNEIRSLLFIPEWSIVSAVIAGQAIVRFASLAMGRKNVRKEHIVLGVTLMLVIVLAPTLLILVFVLTASLISNALAITQGVFFVLSLAAFTVTAWVENSIKIDDEEEERK